MLVSARDKILPPVVMLMLPLVATASIAQGRCREESKESFIKSIPFFVKGSVSKFTTEKNNNGTAEVSFVVNVIEVYKGRLSDSELRVKYRWTNSKESIRLFENGKTYLFAIEKLDSANATIVASSCAPAVTPAEITALIEPGPKSAPVSDVQRK
jgi:hypothetical protein